MCIMLTICDVSLEKQTVYGILCILIFLCKGAREINKIFLCDMGLQCSMPGRIGKSVTCLATDVSLTADPGVMSLIQAHSHTFV